jgi:membrane associated rhomboid family serine protease
VVNALVVVWQSTSADARGRALVCSAGAIPREITTLRDIGPAAWCRCRSTVVTRCFCTEACMHLVGNMWFLWLFGDNVEDRLGRLRFLSSIC